ncbi:hypothetical protein D3C73_1618840 [compost metagenome]
MVQDLVYRWQEEKVQIRVHGLKMQRNRLLVVLLITWAITQDLLLKKKFKRCSICKKLKQLV